MSITREQVANLQRGDVVELTSHEGSTVRGTLATYGIEKGLTLGGGLAVRRGDGEPIYLWTEKGWSLTVVSRAPRPLYVNHPRSGEPALGDIVGDADGESGRTWTAGLGVWRRTTTGLVYGRLDLPAHLRLLVDGETGQVVPS